MKTIYLAALICLINNIMVNAQPMTINDLDFWIGSWSCITDDTVVGENTIQKILDKKVVEENFHLLNDNFKGRSWSVFDSASSVWKQTWVDNNGAYMAFTGRKVADTLMFIENEPMTINGHKVYRRMIFYSILMDSFEWKWQSSKDRINWKTNWDITYKRK
jgi:hypothetical protein